MSHKSARVYNSLRQHSFTPQLVKVFYKYACIFFKLVAQKLLDMKEKGAYSDSESEDQLDGHKCRKETLGIINDGTISHDDPHDDLHYIHPSVR